MKDDVKTSAASLALGDRWIFHQDNDQNYASALVQNLLKGPGLALSEPRPQSY